MRATLHKLLRYGLCIALIAPVSAARAFESCEKASRQQAKDIRSSITQLRRSLPKNLQGPQVPSGPCVIRALKLGITMGTTKTYPNVHDVENQIACLELELFYLNQFCVCQKLDKAQSRDPTIEAGMLETYRNVRKLEQAARKKGIPNPAIREFVRIAQAARDCFSKQSLDELQTIETTLDKLIQ